MNTALITQVCQKFGIPQAEAQREYERISNEAKTVFGFLPAEELAKRIDFTYATYYKDMAKSNAHAYEGIVYGLEPKNFLTRKRIDKVLKAFKTSPADVMAQKMVKLNENGSLVLDKDNNPIVVEHTEFFNKGTDKERRNKNFGMPLDAQDYQRTVYGVVSDNGMLHKFTMTLRGNYKALQIPMNKVVSFRAILTKKNEDNSLVLSATKSTRFVDSGKDVNMSALYSTIMRPTPLSAIEAIVTDARENKIFGVTTLVQGKILGLNLASQNGKISFRIMEESTNLDNMDDISISMSEDMAGIIDFSEDDTVQVFGSPWVMTDQNTGSKRMGMTGYGVCTVVKGNHARINAVETPEDIGSVGHDDGPMPYGNDEGDPQ